MKRRHFLKQSPCVAAAFLGLERLLMAGASAALPLRPLYGPLVKDPRGLLDLPAGFSYRVVSRFGEKMADGHRVPGLFDGMAAFPGGEGRIILVRNHELALKNTDIGPFKDNRSLPPGLDPSLLHDAGDAHGRQPSLGGTTTVVYDPATGKTEKQYLSLMGTDRNCAGGAMPWGSWITAEEPADMLSERGARHGYCFEVRATEQIGLQKAVPLKALGRFRHEAVALDERSGILYLTEDRADGLLYRFVPDKPGQLANGKLQALALNGNAPPDTRNYEPGEKQFPLQQNFPAHWIDLEDIDSPQDDLRHRGHKAGAARFARSEGIVFAGDHLYIACTDGGNTRQGQIFKLTPGAGANQADQLMLYIQPQGSDLMNNGDNLAVSPANGDLIVCEDLIEQHREQTPHLRVVTTEGELHTLARNALNKSEFAGSTFSADGSILFVNIQSPGYTLAITGPWQG